MSRGGMLQSAGRSSCRTTALPSLSTHLQQARASPSPSVLLCVSFTQQRIEYKVVLLTFKVRSTLTPSYLHRLIQDRQHSHNLRSTTTTLCQPFTTTTFAKRAYRCSAPSVWNSLPKTVLSSDSVAVFKSRLKQRWTWVHFSGRLKMHDLKMQDWKMTDNFARNRRVWKMQDWKMTDNISANSEQNYGVWKMQDWKMTDHVN